MLKLKAKINILKDGKIVEKGVIQEVEVSKVFHYKGVYLFQGKFMNNEGRVIKVGISELTTALSFNSQNISQAKEHFDHFGIDRIKELITGNEKVNAIEDIGNKKVIDIEYELSIAENKKELTIAKRLFTQLKKAYPGLILHLIADEYRSVNKGVSYHINFKESYLQPLIDVMVSCKVKIPITID